MSTSPELADVVVVGAGPAGLTAARELRKQGVGSVVVLEREAEAGGIPRHSNHTGYGIRDLRRVMSGPRYARRLATEAVHSGAALRTESMVTGWDDDCTLWVTSPGGRYRMQALAIVLATGARERPRTARMVPGDRPAGVLTTGQLQSLVYAHGRQLGGNAVVVGAELVSWSAVLTLRHAGCRTTLMTTRHARPESYAAFTMAGRSALSVSVATRTSVTRIIGHGQVRAVEIKDLVTGGRRIVPCDVVVFTGDWIPDLELARLRGVEMDVGHRGPVVDSALCTSAEGIFAAGNLIHPVDTADIAALDGSHVAEQVANHLKGQPPRQQGFRITVREPFTWVTPSVIGTPAIAPPRSRVLLWSNEFRALPTIEVSQAGAVICRRRVPWPVSPGRVFRLPWGMFASADPDRGDVVVSLA
ncbi:MAG: NAD(P)/FAD-dependent oxidoreductase [Actinomycetia bacterium]|nr:NAD(P)/FAD-dependent oxidoreductase [Actinomycetes bacterium]